VSEDSLIPPGEGPGLALSGAEVVRADLHTLADVGLARIRTVLARLGHSLEDIRVFKLAPSHFRQWTPLETDDPALYAARLAEMVDPLLPGWTTEAVIYEIALKEGFGLDLHIETIQLPTHPARQLFRVTDPGRDQSFFITLDEDLTDFGDPSAGSGQALSGLH